MRKILLSLAAVFLAASASAQMKFVDRGANVYYRFSLSGQISPVEKTDSYVTTNDEATCILESRSFTGTTPNTQGQYGYEYRITLNGNGTGSNVVKVSSLTLKFPDPQFFSYGLTSSNQVWIVGSDTGIVPSGADQSDNKVTFDFSPPITLTPSDQGTNTCLFGMVSYSGPQITTAILAGSTKGPTNGVVDFTAELQAQTP
jgi:hypothetical protein